MAASNRTTDPGRIGGKFVPLHRLPENFRRSPASERSMRGYVPEHDLVAPSGLNEALKLIADQARPMAGGTDIGLV
jgi:hypothetical protein